MVLSADNQGAVVFVLGVQPLSRVQLFVTHGLPHARLPCPFPSPGVYPNSCPLSRQCHPAISSSVVPFSSHLQSFPASGSFLMSQLFASCGWSIIRALASASVLPMNRCVVPMNKHPRHRCLGWLFPAGTEELTERRGWRCTPVGSSRGRDDVCSAFC